MCQLKIPKIWRKALIVAIPKPEKPLGDPKSYRPISLLCAPFKILKRLIYGSVEPITDPCLPPEQTGLRHGRSAIDQVTLLTTKLRIAFQLKSLELCLLTSQQPTTLYGIPASSANCCDFHMMMEMVGNHSFTLTTGNSKRSRLRHLKNSVPQGSVLAPLLSNIYISDLPTTVSRKYAYVDDLAIMHADGDWQAVEGVLSKDMGIPPDLEVEAQCYKNGVSNLALQQQGS